MIKKENNKVYDIYGAYTAEIIGLKFVNGNVLAIRKRNLDCRPGIKIKECKKLLTKDEALELIPYFKNFKNFRRNNAV